MKHILIILFSIITLSAYAQPGSLSQSLIRLRVNDSTTVVPSDAQGYGSIYWNNQATNPGWRVWVDGVGYVIWDPTGSGGNFWKNAGTTTLTANTIIDGGGFNLEFSNLGNWTLAGVGTAYMESGTDMDIVAGDELIVQVTNALDIDAGGPVTIDATDKISFTATDSINFTAPIIKLGGQVGTIGQVPTINASGVLKYATPSGGGSNIYNADGTLTAARTLTGGGFDLTMSGMSSLTTDATGDINFLSSGASVVLQSATIAITDAATMDITDAKHTLTTSSATRTFTQSFNGDFCSIVVTLNTTSSVFTFPAGALCVSEGLLSGDNTLSLSGASGDKYFISIAKYGSAYYVVCKSFGQ